MEKTMSVTGKAVDLKLLKRVISYSIPYKSIFSGAIATTLLLALLAPLKPILIQYTIDTYIIQHSNISMITWMCLGLIVILILETLLQFLDAYLASLLGQNVISDLRQQLFKHVCSLRVKYFDNTPIGMLVTRTVSDIETIADVFSEGLIVIIGDILKLTVIVIAMFYINVKLTLICLSTIPFMLLATWIFKNAVKAAFQEVRTQVARLNTFVQEHLTGVNIVQIFNREKKESDLFKEINLKHTQANIRSVWHYSVFFPVVEILSSVSLALLVWWGGNGVLENEFTLGNITSFIFFLNMMFRPIRQLADRFNTLQMGMVGCERVFKLLDTDEKVTNNTLYNPIKAEGHIEFKNVWFAYNDEQWVLKDISLEASKGSTIALVGSTGSGKSSIINLLNRFYEYNKGEILIDGKSIRNYDLRSLRNSISIVLQDVFLFSDTIANNISLADKNISREQIIEAAKAIGAHDFIMKLPGNYDYNVMERGATLSVGQRQLISFIRAYVHQPSILILDEATSSIDTESEELIQKAIDKLTHNRTSIVIAHRLTTIQKANCILVMDHGKIVEKGNHQQLLQQNGIYKKLFDLQFEGKAI